MLFAHTSLYAIYSNLMSSVISYSIEEVHAIFGLEKPRLSWFKVNKFSHKKFIRKVFFPFETSKKNSVGALSFALQ